MKHYDIVVCVTVTAVGFSSCCKCPVPPAPPVFLCFPPLCPRPPETCRNSRQPRAWGTSKSPRAPSLRVQIEPAAVLSGFLMIGFFFQLGFAFVRDYTNCGLWYSYGGCDKMEEIQRTVLSRQMPEMGGNGGEQAGTPCALSQQRPCAPWQALPEEWAQCQR